jgi:hypothetical protein
MLLRTRIDEEKNKVQHQLGKSIEKLDLKYQTGMTHDIKCARSLKSLVGGSSMCTSSFSQCITYHYE